DRLTTAQAATLGGKIRAPSTLDPDTNPNGLLARRNQVVRNMAKHHWLTAAQRQDATTAPLGIAPPHPGPPERAPHFVGYVEREVAALEDLGGTPESRARLLFTGGMTIETTLDPKALDAA